jgi:hypothetical protein
MACHVIRDIERNGPPRAWWCMAFEAHNQVIKSLFKNSNYKSAAQSVVDLWIFRSARSLKRSAAALWSLDTACTASEVCLDIDSMCLSSELLPLVRVPEIVGARSLHSFTRGPVSIIAGAWIAVQSAVEPGIAHACQISEITQVFTQQSWHIRMLASESFELDESFETTWFSKPMCELAGDYMLIDAESVHLSELHVVREGPLLRLRYLW